MTRDERPFCAGRMGYGGCSNRGSTVREGVWYCGVHDPEKVATRQAKRDAVKADERAALVKARDAADRLEDEFTALTGIHGHAHSRPYGPIGAHPSEFTIRLADLPALLERLRR